MSMSVSSLQGVELVGKADSKKILNQSVFQKLVQISSCSNFSVFEQLQDLIRSQKNQYTTADILLCRKIYLHLFQEESCSNEEMVRKVIDIASPFLTGLEKVRKNWDREGLFPKLTQEDLYYGVRDKVENGELVFGQLVLIEEADGDVDFEILDRDLMEGKKGLTEREESCCGLDPSGNSFDSVEGLSGEEHIEDMAWNKNFTPIFPEDEPDYVLIDSPLDMQNEGLLRDPFFKKLVQICSVNDFSIDKWSGTNSKILDQLQNLIALPEKVHSPINIRLAKKVYAHLLYEGVEKNVSGSDQRIVGALKDLIIPYISEVRTVLKNIHSYKNYCFPSFPASVTGKDLFDYLAQGKLVYGQRILINGAFECLNNRLIKQMEEINGIPDEPDYSLEEWLSK